MPAATLPIRGARRSPKIYHNGLTKVACGGDAKAAGLQGRLIRRAGLEAIARPPAMKQAT
ncbi:MAG TPA: hypothetical protein VLY46_11375 [Usitatibacter sp.]|nr:hypothetical protein [Usitatibacter sp.]